MGNAAPARADGKEESLRVQAWVAEDEVHQVIPAFFPAELLRSSRDGRLVEVALPAKSAGRPADPETKDYASSECLSTAAPSRTTSSARSIERWSIETSMTTTNVDDEPYSRPGEVTEEVVYCISATCSECDSHSLSSALDGVDPSPLSGGHGELANYLALPSVGGNRSLEPDLEAVQVDEGNGSELERRAPKYVCGGTDDIA